MKNKLKKGFTLIELLVVVAIMGLLASLAIIALNQARAKARDARRVSDIKQIQTALELYYLDQNEYPDHAAANVMEGYCLSGSNHLAPTCSGTVYMAEIPGNPEPRVDGSCPETTYSYVAIPTTNKNLSYQIRYCLGTATGDLAAGEHIATPAGLTDN